MLRYVWIPAVLPAFDASILLHLVIFSPSNLGFSWQTYHRIMWISRFEPQQLISIRQNLEVFSTKRILYNGKVNLGELFQPV